MHACSAETPQRESDPVPEHLLVKSLRTDLGNLLKVHSDVVNRLDPEESKTVRRGVFRVLALALASESVLLSTQGIQQDGQMAILQAALQFCKDNWPAENPQKHLVDMLDLSGRPLPLENSLASAEHWGKVMEMLGLDGQVHPDENTP